LFGPLLFVALMLEGMDLFTLNRMTSEIVGP